MLLNINDEIFLMNAVASAKQAIREYQTWILVRPGAERFDTVLDSQLTQGHSPIPATMSQGQA
jgi:hypothetical protein